MRKWHHRLTADEVAIELLRRRQALIPAKHHTATRIVSNAIRHLKGEEIHPDNRGSVASVWRRL